MFHVSTGHTTAPTITIAAQQLIEQCKIGLPPVANPNAGILFASPHYDHQTLLTAIHHQWRSINLIGCTAPTCISNHNLTLNFNIQQPESKHHSATLMVFQSDQILIQAGYIDKFSDCDNETAVQNKIRAALPNLPQPTALCIALLPCFPLSPQRPSISERHLVKQLTQVIGQHTPLVGGAAGADLRGDCVRLFYGETINHNEGLVCLLFSEPLQVNIATIPGLHNEGGWHPTHDDAQPASVQNGVYLHKVGEVDAKTFYDYANRHATWVLQPLRVQDGNESYLVDVNYPASTDLPDNALRLFNQIPDGVGLQNTIYPKPDKLVQFAQQNIAQAINDHQTPPQAALAFSCLGRLLYLQDKMHKYQPKDELGKLTEQAKFIGFHTYGEVGKLNHENHSEYHNSSMFIVFLSEKTTTTPEIPATNTTATAPVIVYETGEVAELQRECLRLQQALDEYESNTSGIKLHTAKVRERATMALLLSLLLNVLVKKDIAPLNWRRGEKLNFDYVSNILANQCKISKYRINDVLRTLDYMNEEEIISLENLMRYMRYEMSLDELKKMLKTKN